MNSFARYIHKKYHRGCLEMLDNAINLTLPMCEMIYILYCYNLAFKSPYLDKDEFYLYARNLKFGEFMEELLVARDVVFKNMNKEIREIESHFPIWREDSKPNIIEK